MNSLLRTVLIGAAPLLWIGAVILGLGDNTDGLLLPVTAMAFAGTICGALREQRDEALVALAREVVRRGLKAVSQPAARPPRSHHSLLRRVQ